MYKAEVNHTSGMSIPLLADHLGHGRIRTARWMPASTPFSTWKIFKDFDPGIMKSGDITGNEQTSRIQNTHPALRTLGQHRLQLTPTKLRPKHWSALHTTQPQCWWEVALVSPHTVKSAGFLAHPQEQQRGCVTSPCASVTRMAEPIYPIRIKPASTQHICRQINSLSCPPAPLCTDAFSITYMGQEKRIKLTTSISTHLKLR